MLRAGECLATMASTRRTERHSAGMYEGDEVHLTLPMLKLLSSKAKGHQYF